MSALTQFSRVGSASSHGAGTRLCSSAVRWLLRATSPLPAGYVFHRAPSSTANLSDAISLSPSRRAIARSGCNDGRRNSQRQSSDWLTSMQEASDAAYGARLNQSRIWSVAGAVAIAALLLQVAPIAQSAGSIGQWLTLLYLLPTNLNPVHVALMKNGRSSSSPPSSGTSRRTATMKVGCGTRRRALWCCSLRPGYVLQQYVRAAGRSCADQRRHPAIRPVLRRAAQRRVQFSDRCI